MRPNPPNIAWISTHDINPMNDVIPAALWMRSLVIRATMGASGICTQALCTFLQAQKCVDRRVQARIRAQSGGRGPRQHRNKPRASAVPQAPGS
jgi:hypothetical protein